MSAPDARVLILAAIVACLLATAFGAVAGLDASAREAAVREAGGARTR